MNHSTPGTGSGASVSAAQRTTRSTPSAPSPRRRSQSAATLVGVRSRVASGSGSTMKSFSVPWPLLNCTSRAYLGCQRGHGAVEEAGGGGVEPVDAGVATGPGALAANEASGGANRLRRGAGVVPRAVESGDDLLVAQRT